jgi:hypothetical protein
MKGFTGDFLPPALHPSRFHDHRVIEVEPVPFCQIEQRKGYSNHQRFLFSGFIPVYDG